MLLFLILINGEGGDGGGNLKNSLSTPRGGKILLNNIKL